MSEETNAIDPAHFRSVMGAYPTGVTLVTAMDGDDPVAMVIGSFGSVSLDPPLVMFMPTSASHSWQRIEKSGSFCVNVLADDQLDLSNSFFNKEVDPFDAIDWTAGPTGSPIIPGCCAYMDCTIEATHPGGDHLIVLGRVQELSTGDTESGPLLFLGGKYGSYQAMA